VLASRGASRGAIVFVGDFVGLPGLYLVLGLRLLHIDRMRQAVGRSDEFVAAHEVRFVLAQTDLAKKGVEQER
jgi:hypothetical protein